MQMQFQTSGLKNSEKEYFEKYAQKKFSKLQSLLKKFDPDTVILHLNIEHMEKHNAFIFKAHLELPKHSIHHEESKHNLEEVIDLCYENIHQQMVKDKEKHSQHKRMSA